MPLNRPSTFLLAALAVCATTFAQAGDKIVINNTDHDIVVTISAGGRSYSAKILRDRADNHNVKRIDYGVTNCDSITFSLATDDASSRTDMGTGLSGGIPGMDALGANPNGVGGTAISNYGMDKRTSDNVINKKEYFTVTLAAGVNGPSFKIDW